MGTYDEVQVGDRFTSPSRVITWEDMTTIVRVGGYTHPLFTTRKVLEGTPFPSTPMPGQGVLLVMGGLVEQTERFDETVLALVGFKDVRFSSPVLEGDDIHVEVEVLEKKDGGARKGFAIGTMTMRWTVHNDRQGTVLTAMAEMMFRRAL